MWERNAFRGNEISLCIAMSPPGLRKNMINLKKKLKQHPGTGVEYTWYSCMIDQ